MSHLVAYFVGALCWTWVEYWLHRGVGHRVGARNPFSVEHLKHHATVTWFAPAWKKGLAAVAAVGFTAPGLVLWLGTPGLAVSAGFVTMYLAYEVIHRRLHTHAGWNAYGRWARRHHLHHHFSRPKLNHGVTSPLWDVVFGTLEVPLQVQVPRRNALPWMLDATGELRVELAAQYVLGHQARTR